MDVSAAYPCVTAIINFIHQRIRLQTLKKSKQTSIETERGYATVSHPSVRPFVCPSVCDIQV